MRDYLERIARCIGVWLGLFLGIYILIVISFALPNGRVRKNLSLAADTLASEGLYPNSYTYDSATQLDNFTDSLILSVAYNNGRNDYSAFKKAVSSSYYNDVEDSSDMRTINSFVKQTKEDLPANTNYSRYWFTTSALIRFLIAFINLQQIRSFLFFVVFVLLIIACCLVSQYLGIKYAVAFAIAMLFMRVYVVPNSLQFTPVTVIALLGIVAVCFFSKEKQRKKIYPYIFLVLGTLTAFFDLLTFPLITLGLPLTIFFLLELKTRQKDFSLRKTVRSLAVSCAIWGLCYGATYFAKWVLTSIVLNENTIATAFHQFFFRTGANGEIAFSRFEMLKTLIGTYYGEIGLIMLVVWLIISVAIMIVKKRGFEWKKLILFVALAVLPYAWYLILANHSFLHFWMTYRIQAISLFSILAGTIYMLEGNKTRARGYEGTKGKKE